VRLIACSWLVLLGASMASGPTLAGDVLDLTNAGWGRAGNNHLWASVSFLNGDRPVGTDGGVESYHRLQTWLMYQYYSYFDKTYLGTLVGGEISVGFGYVSPESANPSRQPEPSENWKPVHFKSEGAFDYALVHWDGLVAGRIVFGAGGGVELGSSWYSVNGNSYPLILGRMQLFFGDSVALHAKYQYVPITSDAARDTSYRIQEHHAEAFVSYRHFYAGAQFQSVVVVVPKTGTLVANDIGAMIGALF
jgi:hypothetical protein